MRVLIAKFIQWDGEESFELSFLKDIDKEEVLGNSRTYSM